MWSNLSLRQLPGLCELVHLGLRQLLVPVLGLEGGLQLPAALPRQLVAAAVSRPPPPVGLEPEPDADRLVQVELEEVAEEDEEGRGDDRVQQVVEICQP